MGMLLYKILSCEFSCDFRLDSPILMKKPEKWIGLRPFNEGVQLVYGQQISSDKAITGHSVHCWAFLFNF